MSDPTTPLEPREEAELDDHRDSADREGLLAERDQLRRQITGRDEEILRLRDLLIGRDAELGALRGQLLMIEDHSKRVSGMAARIPIPGAGFLIRAFMRLLAGRQG